MVRDCFTEIQYKVYMGSIHVIFFSIFSNMLSLDYIKYNNNNIGMYARINIMSINSPNIGTILTWKVPTKFIYSCSIQMIEEDQQKITIVKFDKSISYGFLLSTQAPTFSPIILW